MRDLAPKVHWKEARATVWMPVLWRGAGGMGKGPRRAGRGVATSPSHPRPPASAGGDQPPGERHRDHAADQRQDQQHGPAAPRRPQPPHQPALHAPKRHRGPRRHGRFCQLREGT